MKLLTCIKYFYCSSACSKSLFFTFQNQSLKIMKIGYYSLYILLLKSSLCHSCRKIVNQAILGLFSNAEIGVVNYNTVKLSSVAWDAVEKKTRVSSSVSFCSILCHAFGCFAFKYDDAEGQCLMTEKYIPISTTSNTTELFRHERAGRFFLY